MIRPIERADITTCADVIRTSFLTVAKEYGFTEENAPRFTAFATTAERLECQLDEGRPMYAYCDHDGQITGYYSLRMQDNDSCELNNLCVLPDHRHHRIGEALFSHALIIAAEKNCTKMTLGIVEENTRLRAWYERLGAEHVGTKKFDFFPFTCGYMEKRVDAPRVEFWDACHADNSLAGCDLVRGEQIPHGLRHRVASVFVMHADGSILLMQRDFRKPNYPGFWECGAGGSIIKGEDVLDGARRELSEETGITVRGEELEQLYQVVSDRVIYSGYLCVTDFPKDQIRLQQGETVAFRWVDQTEFLEIYRSNQLVDSPRGSLDKFVGHRFQI